MCLKFDSQRTHHRLYLKDGQSVATLICPRCLIRSPRLSPCILFFIVYFTLNNDNDFIQMNIVALAIS